MNTSSTQPGPSDAGFSVTVAFRGGLGDEVLYSEVLYALKSWYPYATVHYRGSAALSPFFLASGLATTAGPLTDYDAAALETGSGRYTPDLDLAFRAANWCALHTRSIDPRSVDAVQDLCQARVIAHHPWQGVKAAPGSPHWSSYFHALYAQHGLPLPPPGPARLAPPPCPPFLASQGVPLPTPYICLAPGASGRWKRYPDHRWGWLRKRFNGFHLVWLIDPSAHDLKLPLLLELADGAARASDSLIVDADLTPWAHTVARGALYIGNDTGTTHLAAALGVPTIAIFGRTNPEQWRPLGDHVRVVQPFKRRGPIGFIRPDDIARAADELIPAWILDP
ncbi:hypothetical protein GF348_24285 [candidate division KSB3 bacterium]|nr:hypothetical protein [candidate division KSB3 bacterium]